MQNHTAAIAAAFVIVLSTACSRGEDAAQKTPPPDARRVDMAKAGTLAGRVTIEGAVPRNAVIKMSGDPICERAHKGETSFETFVSENGGLGNVFVYVKDGLGNYFFDTPSAPVVLDQKGCQYVPHVFGVRVGQQVQFVNSDATTHNVHALPTVNREFNFGQPIQNQKDSKVFAKHEVMVRIKCDMHNWMLAYAGVLEHPYFAVTRPGGEFELKNLPAGTYTIEAWHEKLGSQTQSITLADSDKKDLTFTFRGSAETAP